jgi:hypothetical protein
VIIDRGMQVVVAASTLVGATVGRPSGLAAEPVATTGGDAAKLLGIQMDQVAWPGCS